MADMQMSKYRKTIWDLVRECAACDLDTCEEWCAEMCNVEIDEMLERLASDVRASMSGDRRE